MKKSKSKSLNGPIWEVRFSETTHTNIFGTLFRSFGTFLFLGGGKGLLCRISDFVTLHTSWCLLPGLHNCRLGGLHWIPEGRHLQNSNGCLSPTFHLTLADSLLRPSLDPHSSHQMSQNQGTKWDPHWRFLMLNTLVPSPGETFSHVLHKFS